ncbi:tryptophan 2,3-dioxygenase family protein [Kibdelosporangium philippinense]|uniref:Tryptophan 2,3-dioxygenase family protein n=1 Tax=Kibdelosporangium philippinense TaxID=211113 RepID=A0ABS8ZPW8_9PSEU|nr:tryptophan 2,3-dioxygenase family protein [Kibdelosporangium philippinense]MCE7009624.1 tryptophan 2,3-dioxygenase family protein [Kibdelosporangium philippinense]
MTAYNAYLRADQLHALQQPVTDTDGELSFLAVCQVQELYFGLIAAELRRVIEHLQTDAVPEAITTLRRIAAHFTALNASWKSLEWMTVGDFLPIKDGLSAEHGKSSSLQSWKFREMAFLLDLKSAELAQVPGPHGDLHATLHAPCVYTAVLHLLHRRGLPVPQEVLDVASECPRQPHPGVAEVWSTVFYGDDGGLADLRSCGEALMRVAEGYGEYQYLHLTATRRSFGDRPGYYGTSGVGWLEKSSSSLPFPDLWTMNPA